MMKFDSHTTDKDLGAKELLKQVEAFNRASVDTGLFEGEKHPDSEFTIAEIGAVNEFGSKDGHVPERSWLRRAAREYALKWKRYIDQGLDRVVKGKGKVKALPVLLFIGEQIASDVRRTINEVTEPPKAPATLAHEGKRFTHPLIWLGYMRAAVRSRVKVRHGSPTMTPKAAVRS